MKKFLIVLLPMIFIFVIFILTTVNSSTGMDHKTKRIQNYFTSEKEYMAYLENNVSFKNITLHIKTIKRGDNFWLIARDHGINIDTLIGANPHWNNLFARINQKIIVPNTKGVLHFIENFSQVEDLIKLYNIKKEDIAIQKLPFLYKYYYQFLSKKKPIVVFVKDVKPKARFMSDALGAQFKIRELFRSPLAGRYSSYFGNRRHPIFRNWGFHNGIDIAAPYGTLVGASREGRVIAAGWMGGYGKAIIIAHKNGYKTLYGHLSSIHAWRGAYVGKGYIIGRVGSTGWSTGPHLHFTLWHNNKLINPMKVLW